MATWKPGQVITDASLNARDMVGKLVFQAGRAAVQAIANNTVTAISWDTPTVDTLGAYSGGSPTRFTPTVAGWYTFSGIYSFASNSTNSRAGYWRLNGTSVNAVQIPGHSQSPTETMPSISIQMNGTTDYVELGVYQDSGGSLNTVTGANKPFINVIYSGGI